MAKISLCMIVKDEEANLAACLRPVRGLVDDIVVVDTGSADRTKEIASSLGARVFDFPWRDDFSAARNESLRHARGEWVFWLDADDRLDDANVNKLERLFGKLAEPAAYYMNVRGDEAPEHHGGINQVRLFKLAPEARWEYRVHEQIAATLLRLAYPLHETDIMVRHTGYRSPEVVRRKWERNLRLLLLDIAEHPREPPIHFHLGMTYVLLARFAEAIPFLEEALSPLRPHHPEARFVFRYLVDALRGVGHVDLALQRCVQGLEWFPDDAYLKAMENSLATQAQKASMKLPQALDLAMRHYQAGRLQQAEQLYQQILQVAPNQVDALHLLGLIAGQTGRYDPAADYLKATVRLKPDFAAAHNNLGNVFVRQGKLQQAVDSFRQAVRCKPDFAEAHCNLGNALREQGGLDEAVVHLREALRLRPDHAEAHNNLGIALLGEQGDLDEAVVHLREALRLRPDYAEAHYTLGLALLRKGKPEEAEASCQQALRLKPGYAEALNILGLALQEQEKLSEAAASYQQALHYRPDFAEAHVNLGRFLWKQRKFEAAYARLQQALRVQPDNADAYHVLGGVCMYLGRLDDAIAALRTALRLKPDSAHIHSSLISTLHYHPGYDAEVIYEESRRWNQQHAEPLRQLIQPHLNDPDPERRLRVGYVSPDFREHVDRFFTIPLLSNHDHLQYEIVLYAGVAHPDWVTAQLRGYADVWRSTVGLSDQQLADLVRGDRIDILVDMKLHTANNRLLMFARKPAPVQVTWLGYPGTTGLTTIDYRLTDPYLDPPGRFDAFYSEESIRLPDSFWCYDPLTDQPPVNLLPALQSGVITFGCLNNLWKINDGCLALWAQVLRAVPQSCLLLLAPTGEPRDRVAARLQHEGIAAARLQFADRQPPREYLRLHHRIDLSLDPMPYNGHTTSLDAFWMGVPTITLLGKTIVGRAGWSMLCNLGLQELAAETPEQYVALAVQLASDRLRLQELRNTLRPRMQESPLMDGKRFARHVEQAYRQMWHRWCQQPRPA